MKIVDDFVRAIEFHFINPGRSFLTGLLALFFAVVASTVILTSFIKLLSNI